MSQPLDFFTLNEFFLNIGAVDSPASLQGNLCGRLCGGGSIEIKEWRAIALEQMGLDYLELNDEENSVIDSLYEVTLSLLNDVNMGFMPLLPTDESSIVRRTVELGAWCEGFLKGLAASGLNADKELSAVVTEALRDLAQISQADIEDDDDLEENEVYWQGLVEHVKVLVLNIYTELSQNPQQQKPEQDDKVVH